MTRSPIELFWTAKKGLKWLLDTAGMIQAFSCQVYRHIYVERRIEFNQAKHNFDVISNPGEDECVGRCLWWCLSRPRVDIGPGCDACCHQAHSTPDPPCLRPVKRATKRPIDRGATSATGGPQLLAVKSPQLSQTSRRLVLELRWLNPPSPSWRSPAEMVGPPHLLSVI